MYEQFSIDSKLLKPNLSFLKSIEENNSRINSFSIKGSMIQNPVGDIDIVDKRNLKPNKINNSSNSNFLLKNNQSISNINQNNHDEFTSKLNLSHIKITSNQMSSASNQYSPFINKNNISIPSSPNKTIDSNKISINSQNNPNYKKGMFSYPRTGLQPVIPQSNNANIIAAKPSFSNIQNRPNKTSSVNSINSSLKDDVTSQRSSSTSKFDLNKFKISKNNDLKSVEDVINRNKLEPNTNKHSIVSGNVSPTIQTLDNISLNHNNYPTNNFKGLGNPTYNPSLKNNFTKYLIVESSKDVMNNNISLLNTKNNHNLNNTNIKSVPEKAYSKELNQVKTYNPSQDNNQLNNRREIKQGTDSVQNTPSKKKGLYNEGYLISPKQEVESKSLIQENAIASAAHEIESRRMTIELVKIILKTTASLNNNAINAFKQINMDSNIINPGKFSNKLSTNKVNDNKASFFTLKKMNETQSQISNSLEIKNNNFEINNYYGNYNNNSVDDKANNLNTSKFLTKTGQVSPLTTYDLNENSDEKLKWLSNLITPRVMTMRYDKDIVPFIFKLVPTNLCFTHGLEHYVLEFEHFANKKEKGSIDLLKINHCTLKEDSSMVIALDNDQKDLEFFEIFAQNKAIASMYVQSINYMSQLIKCKIYAKTQIK